MPTFLGMGRLGVPGVLPGLLFACAHQPEYSPAEAAKYLQFARAAFCDQDAIEEWTCGDMCKDAPIVPGSARIFGPGKECGVQGFVAKLLGTSRCVLSFRGSVSSLNWQTDADIFLTDWPPAGAGGPQCAGCQVHGGFALAYRELRAKVWHHIRSLACSGLTVTGHSLGAAIGTLATMDFRGGGSPVEALWTFGSPRVGNPTFVAAFIEAARKQGVEMPSWRVVHYHDPVPQGGPTEFYTHVPGEVYYTERSSAAFELCGWTAESPENETCGSRTLSSVDVIEGLSAGDHVMYLNKTLQLNQMNEQCVPTNRCTREGFVRRSFLVALTVLVGLAGCCGGACSVLAWQRYKAARAVMLVQPLVRDGVAMSNVAAVS